MPISRTTLIVRMVVASLLLLLVTACEATQTEPGITVEGPVEAITENSITVLGLEIQVDPENPILTEISLDDMVRVEGDVFLEDDGTTTIVAENISLIDEVTSAVYVAAALNIDCHLKKSGRVTCKQAYVPSIVIEGPLEAITGSLITVLGTEIQLPDDLALVEVSLNDLVRVEGDVIVEGETTTIIAHNILLIDEVVSPVYVATALDVDCHLKKSGRITCKKISPDLIPVMIIEGPVQGIEDNFIIVSGLEVEIDPDDPILTTLSIDDLVHIEADASLAGETVFIVANQIMLVDVVVNPVYVNPVLNVNCKIKNSGKISCKNAFLASPLILEGAVQVIDGNTITILDMLIRLDPNDPILVGLNIGDILRIEGEAVFEGDVMIIIPITVVVVQVYTAPVYVDPNAGLECKVKRSGRISCKPPKNSNK